MAPPRVSMPEAAADLCSCCCDVTCERASNEQVGNPPLAVASEHVEPYFCSLSACDHCVRTAPASRRTGCASVGGSAADLGISAVQTGRSLSLATRGWWAGAFSSASALVHARPVPLGAQPDVSRTP